MNMCVVGSYKVALTKLEENSRDSEEEADEDSSQGGSEVCSGDRTQCKGTTPSA